MCKISVNNKSRKGHVSLRTTRRHQGVFYWMFLSRQLLQLCLHQDYNGISKRPLDSECLKKMMGLKDFFLVNQTAEP